MTAAAGPLEPVADGVRVALRVSPRAARNAIAGVGETAPGRRAVKVSVTAVPEDGKANAAVVKLLSKAWGVPKSAIAVVGGATDRNKMLHVAGDPAELMRRLGALVEGGEGDGPG